MGGCITIKKTINVLPKYDYNSDIRYLDIECIVMDEMGDTKDMNILVPHDIKGVELIIENISTLEEGK